MGASVAVLGASGYSGGELVRLLQGHGAMDLRVASAGSAAGRPLDEVAPHLVGAPNTTLAPLTEAISADVDVCFSCLPSGVLGDLVDRCSAGMIVDLADDFRSSVDWVYGLSEFARPALGAATRVANPGCYPTATLLALVPFASAGVISGPVSVDGLSGASGAGRRTEDRLLHGSVEGSVAAYGKLPHRHVPEMEAALARFGGLETTISFVPHLVPMTRGLLATARAPLTGALSDADAMDILVQAYSTEPFVDVVETWPTTKAVSGTNRAHVTARVDARTGQVIVVAAIDNLGKGAAGQAIQNANLALGLEETMGLEAFGIWP